MADVEVRIGQLRWPVTIARRRQNFDPPGMVSIFEDWVGVTQVHAEIMPISALTFYGSEQVDMPVTHRITTRWLEFMDQSFIVARTIFTPRGTTRGELYRVRRVKELNGRKRFTSLECELEVVQAAAMIPPVVDPSRLAPSLCHPIPAGSPLPVPLPPTTGTGTPPTTTPPNTTPPATGTAPATVRIIAGTFLPAFTAIELDARGAAIRADPTDRLFAFAGIVTTATPAGQPVTVTESGIVTVDAPRWTPGRSVFIGPLGVLSQVVPRSGISQQVGVAVSPTSMLVQVLPPVWIG